MVWKPAIEGPEDRRLLAVGNTTTEVAKLAGVTPGRISQKRREYLDSYRTFQGERPAGEYAAVAGK